jgi:hypothetical protein
MTNHVDSHYYGDSCPGGHRIDELRARIAQLTRSAEINYEKAQEYERRADARYVDLRDTVRMEHTARAKAGNKASKLVVESDTELKVATDIRAEQDSKWKALVADHKFHTRKANMDNSMVQTLQTELARLEKEST